MGAIWLFAIFLVCTATSLLLCGVAKTLFPTFRSGEHKPGMHRADLVPDGREIKSIRSIELPLLGGPALMLALVAISLGTGSLLHYSTHQWTLLLICLGAALAFALVGFIDDWKKVHSKEGISERAKFIGVFSIGMVAAACYFFLLPASGQESYSFWKDLPLLNTLLCAKMTEQPICPVTFPQVAFFSWLIFLMLLTGFTGTATAVCVDFSDGLDGLAGGLVFSAALAFAIILTAFLDGRHPGGLVLEILALLCAAAVLGFLPWNWPSSWAARRRATAKRRAVIYLGDSGALGLGGLLAMIAVFSRNELLLLLIGGVFVLEGLSAISARVLTFLYRRQLKPLRYMTTRAFIPHTEFPLPFLATPLHHHFDLLGWDRRRLVYGAWALGACFATLGVLSTIFDLTWQRYLFRLLVPILMCLVWSSGTWLKCYFVGTIPEEGSHHRRLALYYGYPYRLAGLKLYRLVESIEASEDIIETPAEELTLWHRVSIFDARAMLGLYCYRSGYYPAAVAQWSRIPERNLALRPEIAQLLADINDRLAVEKQETQPLKRDQLVPKEPVLSGHVSPADLPNPHEPVQREGTALAD